MHENHFALIPKFLGRKSLFDSHYSLTSFMLELNAQVRAKKDLISPSYGESSFAIPALEKMENDGTSRDPRNSLESGSLSMRILETQPFGKFESNSEIPARAQVSAKCLKERKGSLFNGGR
jgi:hypothetical protein